MVVYREGKGGDAMADPATADRPAGRGGLLVVDDEPFLRDAVATSLRFLGFEVTTADTGAGALRLARDRPFDLVVLDVMLPDTDGFDVVRRLREDGCQVPVIFLTARDTQADKVAGLTIGGDDYMTKPFGLEELAARVRTVLRRTRPAAAAAGPVLRFAGIELDQDSYEVRRGGHLVDLSPTEFRLLRYLMLNPGRVLPRAQMLAHVWDYDFGGRPPAVSPPPPPPPCTQCPREPPRVPRHHPRRAHPVRDPHPRPRPGAAPAPARPHLAPHPAPRRHPPPPPPPGSPCRPARPPRPGCPCRPACPRRSG